MKGLLMEKLEAENPPPALLADGSRVRKSANLEARVSQSETAKFVILEYFKGLLFVKKELTKFFFSFL